MKITVIHGQSHKGMTYTMTKELVDNLAFEQDEMIEFFLPKDGPDFCCGCFNCFLKGEENCPSYDKMLPITQAIEQADIVVVDSPNYVMEMSGAMKNLMDHLAYRWIVHRPHSKMFTKVGVALCSSAGAPASHTAQTMAKQLKWMGISKVYCVPFTSGAMGLSDLKSGKYKRMKRKVAYTAKKVQRRARRPRPSLRSRFFFAICRNMQLSPNAAWNPTDRDWWINQGWTKKVKPW